MRLSVTPSAWAILCCLSSASAVWAEPADVAIDLAARGPGSESLSVDPGVPLAVHVHNRVPHPGGTYSVTVRRQAIPIPELPKVSGLHQEAGGACDEALERAAALAKLQDELEVGISVAAIRRLLVGVICPDDVADRIQWFLRTTTMELGNWTLLEGEELVIEVARLDKDKKPTKVWTTILSTGPRGRWMTTYGFAFAPVDDHTFFAKEISQGKYRITREADRQSAAFLPGVFFTWLPANRELRNLSFNVGAGLGFDATNPVVYLGPSLSWNQNVTLVAGAAVRRVKRLNGRYADDQEISENLSPDQLVQGTYRPSAFVALTFRFGASPFATKPKDEKKDGKTKTDNAGK